MFMGQYNQKVDTKGRAIVPAKFREDLGEKFVITKGLDKCIFGFPESEWNILAEKIGALSLTDKHVRKFVRFFLAGAATLETDKQGRVLIPSELRDYAALEKDIIWAGAAKRIEIWNPDRWTENTTDDMDEIAEYMSGLGI